MMLICPAMSRPRAHRVIISSSTSSDNCFDIVEQDDNHHHDSIVMMIAILIIAKFQNFFRGEQQFTIQRVRRTSCQTISQRTVRHSSSHETQTSGDLSSEFRRPSIPKEIGDMSANCGRARVNSRRICECPRRRTFCRVKCRNS